MVGKTCRRGKELVKRRLFDIFAFAARGALRPGVEILREERTKIEFIEGIGRFRLGNFFGFFLKERFVRVAFSHGALFLLFEDGVRHDLLIDHLAQLEAIQRENAYHLDEARRQNLFLSEAEIEFRCKPVHGIQFSRKPSPR